MTIYLSLGLLVACIRLAGDLLVARLTPEKLPEHVRGRKTFGFAYGFVLNFLAWPLMLCLKFFKVKIPVP